MSKFKQGMNVMTIINNELRKGYIQQVYSDLSLAIVKIEEECFKVPFKNLTLVSEEISNTEVPKNCKTIEKEDFETQIEKLIEIKEEYNNINILQYSIDSILAKKLIEKLFRDKDTIEIDKNTLSDTIVDITNPENALYKTFETQVYTMIQMFLFVSLTTMLNVVKHYFGDV